MADIARVYGARLIRVDQTGRQPGAQRRRLGRPNQFIAYIDDDAIPATDWVEAILDAIAQPGRPPALIGGRILPKWEAPLPAWWPRIPARRAVDHRARGARRIPHSRGAAWPGALRGKHGRACAVAAGRGRVWRRHRPLRPVAAVGRGRSARLDAAGRRIFRALRFTDHSLSSDPGAPAWSRSGCCRGSTGRGPPPS